MPNVQIDFFFLSAKFMTTSDIGGTVPVEDGSSRSFYQNVRPSIFLRPQRKIPLGSSSSVLVDDGTEATLNLKLYSKI